MVCVLFKTEKKLCDCGFDSNRSFHFGGIPFERGKNWWQVKISFEKHSESSLLFMAKTCFNLKRHIIYASVCNSCPLLNGIYRLRFGWPTDRPQGSWHERKFVAIFGHE